MIPQPKIRWLQIDNQRCSDNFSDNLYVVTPSILKIQDSIEFAIFLYWKCGPRCGLQGKHKKKLNYCQKHIFSLDDVITYKLSEKLSEHPCWLLLFCMQRTFRFCFRHSGIFFIFYVVCSPPITRFLWISPRQRFIHRCRIFVQLIMIFILFFISSCLFYPIYSMQRVLFLCSTPFPVDFW